MEKQKAIEILQHQLAIITVLKQKNYSCQELKEWKRDTIVALRNIFKGEDKSNAKEFEGIRYSPAVFSSDGDSAPFHRAYARGLESAAAKLKSMIKEVQEYWTDEEVPASKIKRGAGSDLSESKEVFIVHGHDEAAKQTIARFIEQLELTPVILHEQSNKGRTIIEKFEDHSNVGFAVVLMTPDDVGASVNDKENLKPRARQNVILELGFFLGKLGRERVCALLKGVEVPSDYDGVLYILMDQQEGWRLKLAKEIKAAGIDIDLNKVI